MQFGISKFSACFIKIISYLNEGSVLCVYKKVKNTTCSMQYWRVGAHSDPKKISYLLLVFVMRWGSN
jgi:hypothetical protein